VDGSGRSAGLRGKAALAFSLSLVFLGNCGGVSTRERSDRSTGASAGDGDPVGGVSGRGGSAPDGGMIGRGGSAPSGGASGRGGSAPNGGLGGTSGGVPTGGRGGSSGGTCGVELLGDNLRCETGEAYAQGPFAEWYAPVGNLELCEQECLARPNCTAVIDYPDISQPRFGCYVYTTSCDHPSTGVWYEEDAGKDYRKVCDASGACRFEFLGYWLRCENPDSHVRVQGARSIRDCEEACLSNPDCTAITDHFWLNDVGGCYLFTGSCEQTEGPAPGDYGAIHRKVCSVGGRGGASGSGSGAAGGAGGEAEGGVGGVDGEP
jgi:hypothetical protein